MDFYTFDARRADALLRELGTCCIQRQAKDHCSMFVVGVFETC